ncbi:hypothetical protein [Streptomyces sp. NPDC127098]|uniref:hypothetical protein n=1 Tax=Streptomyces sp. NPDC127098 TaxID=3347137 RepID=UPI00365F7E26
MTHDMHDIDGPTEFEQQFGAMLRQAGGGFQPDSQALAEAGLRRGKVRLWRRRAAMVTGAAAVAAVAVAAVQLPGGGGGEGDDALHVADAPRSQSELIATLTAMLPEGVSGTDSYAITPEESGDPGVSLTLGTGDDSLTLDVSMLRWQAEDWRSAVGCGSYDWEDSDRCEETELEDGSVLSVGSVRYDQSPVVDPGTEFAESDLQDVEEWGDTYFASWNAQLAMPASWGPGEEGLWQINATVTSMTDEPLDPDFEPPLDEGQLAEIARASVWQEVLAAADAEHGAPEESIDEMSMSSAIPAEELRALFDELAPTGLEIGEIADESRGSVTFQASAGEVSALVEINTWATGSYDYSDGPIDPECDPVDGFGEDTRVYLCDWLATEDYEPQLYADVYHASGSSVDISVYPADGAESPLTADELSEIAGSQEWLDLLG